MKTQFKRRGVLCLLLCIVGGLCISSAPAFGDRVPATTEVRVTRFLSTSYALPESQFRVTLYLETNQTLAGAGIHEELPAGWVIHPLENDGAAFKRLQSQWVFEEVVRPGRRRRIVYEVTVPGTDRLYADPLPRCFTITGTVQAKVPALEMPVVGDAEIQVVDALPLPSAVAHLVPQTKDSPDRIDLRLAQTIGREQLTRALELWAHDLPVPGTQGEILDLTMMEKLVAHFATCTPVDEPLPNGGNPKLCATRTISTALPYDIVLLPEGCLDPGLAARCFAVSLQITVQQDAYGVGLKEWFPVGWRVTPIQHKGFWYRPSQSEWVYPKRLPKGETIEVVYQVEVAPSAADELAIQNTASGCCGRDVTLVGAVTSGLVCGEEKITGEDTIHVWHCLPVLLAVSRWDAKLDVLDVTLSDWITFAQIQRAMAFWLENTVVPHTCGYMIGYETLKTIITHWLTDTPVTEALPGQLPDTCVAAAVECYEPSGTIDWFCQMRQRQPRADYIGVPPPIVLAVDAGPDQRLTCTTRVATLTATVRAGGAALACEWTDPHGKVIGTTPSILVTEPGTYTITVTGCAGLTASDTVTVIKDTEPPVVTVAGDRRLTCASPQVTLIAEVSGGRPPYALIWETSDGTIIGRMARITVSAPDTYTVTAIGANGCPASASTTVTQDIASPTVDAGPERMLTCNATAATLTATVTGGRPPYALRWTDSRGNEIGTTESITVDVPNTYTVVAIGANGCSASDSVTVSQDTASPVIDVAGIEPLTCSVREVTLTANVSGGRPPYTLIWETSDGTIVGETARITVHKPGDYIITATGANGCSEGARVTVVKDVSSPQVDAGPDRTLTCSDSELVLDASVEGGTPPYAYVWTNACGEVVATTEDIAVTLPGRYTLTVTGANGCSTSDTVAVIDKIIPPTVDAGPDQTLTCDRKEIVLDATVYGGTSPYQYVWTNACGVVVGREEDLVVRLPSLYTLTVTTADGCVGSDSVAVIQESAAPAAP